MKEKLLELLKSEGLKPGQLAEMLGINPAGVSHILAGRNKPGFDLLQKILRRFPRINPDWLLLDSDKMYRDNFEPNSEYEPSHQTTLPVSDLFGATQSKSFSADKSMNSPHAEPGTTNGTRPAGASFVPSLGRPRPAVERVIVFYNDKTFESYSPNAIDLPK